jgi:hypothetical protein
VSNQVAVFKFRYILRRFTCLLHDEREFPKRGKIFYFLLLLTCSNIKLTTKTSTTTTTTPSTSAAATTTTTTTTTIAVTCTLTYKTFKTKDIKVDIFPLPRDLDGYQN